MPLLYGRLVGWTRWWVADCRPVRRGSTALGNSGAQFWRMQIRKLRSAKYGTVANKAVGPVGDSWRGKWWWKQRWCTLIDSRFCAGSKFEPGTQSGQGFVKWWYNKASVIVKSCIQLSAVVYVVECRGNKHSSNGEVGLRVKCRLLDAHRCTDSSSPPYYKDPVTVAGRRDYMSVFPQYHCVLYKLRFSQKY